MDEVEQQKAIETVTNNALNLQERIQEQLMQLSSTPQILSVRELRADLATAVTAAGDVPVSLDRAEHKADFMREAKAYLAQLDAMLAMVTQ